MSSSRLSFGTYNLFSPNLEVALQSAIDNGFRNIDTAQLYHNSSKIGPMITTEFHVTTKIFKHIASDMTVSLCKKSLMYFDGIPATILLHNPAPSASWIGLEQFAAQNPAVKIGVSNHNQHDLEVLARYASVMPVINQIEFNPYVDNTALLVYCRDNNIAVEAHTIFGKGLCLSDPIIMELAEAAQMSSAQLLLQWCLDKEIHVVISTKNAEHLRELIDTYQMNRALSVDITTKLDNIHKTISHRFYNKPIYFIPEITISTNEEIVQYCDMMSAALTNDLAIIKELGDNPPLQKFYNIPISYMVDYAPKNNKAHRELRTLLEKKMNMDSVSYYKTIQKIDEHLIAQKHAADIAKKEKLQNKTCSLSRRPQSDKISEEVMHPAPMPVEIPERMEMLPIFTFLKKNKEPAHDMTFLKGTVFKDGRLDMCKQVVGPTHIKELCESVRDNEHVKHFLLGNNIALNKGYIEGAEAIAQMIRQKDIETYYLAGNCIDADCMRVLTESLVSNTTCRALWLKRNPIGVEGARYLGDMLNVNHTIEILDLQNCGILDEGIEAFCSAITCQPELFSIRYLYLDANGIGSKGATILCEFFKKYNNFRSIFLGLNPLNTLDELRDGLIANKDLENLAVPSIGLINLDNLKEILIGCPRLKVLNLSVAKGTYDLGAVRNWLDEIDAEPLIDILRECGAQLEFLNMRGFIISDENKERVLNAAPNCVIIIGMNNTQRGNPRLKAFELDNEARKHIREIKHSAMISNIDSIYRT